MVFFSGWKEIVNNALYYALTITSYTESDGIYHNNNTSNILGKKKKNP